MWLYTGERAYICRTPHRTLVCQLLQKGSVKRCWAAIFPQSAPVNWIYKDALTLDEEAKEFGADVNQNV